jgi:hypothetical protein
MCEDREVLLLWAVPTWEAWAAYERAQRDDGTVAAWRARTSALALESDRFLLVDAPLSPMRTGRQPSEDDRASFESPA